MVEMFIGFCKITQNKQKASTEHCVLVASHQLKCWKEAVNAEKRWQKGSSCQQRRFRIFVRVVPKYFSNRVDHSLLSLNNAGFTMFPYQPFGECNNGCSWNSLIGRDTKSLSAENLDLTPWTRIHSVPRTIAMTLTYGLQTTSVSGNPVPGSPTCIRQNVVWRMSKVIKSARVSMSNTDLTCGKKTFLIVWVIQRAHRKHKRLRLLYANFQHHENKYLLLSSRFQAFQILGRDYIYELAV